MEESGENWPSDNSNLQDPFADETDRQRELNDSLLALSATIPGLNKMEGTSSIVDKTSKYVKQLEERVRELEHQVESQSSISFKVNSNHYINNVPEVKATVLRKEVLITIHCENQEGIMLKILSQLENLHLSIVNSSVLRFGKSNLNINIVVQMGDGYNMTVDELVRTLREAIFSQ